jgi:predicted DsbA family dithiol-disulfide isomerase
MAQKCGINLQFDAVCPQMNTNDAIDLLFQ